MKVIFKRHKSGVYGVLPLKNAATIFCDGKKISVLKPNEDVILKLDDKDHNFSIHFEAHIPDGQVSAMEEDIIIEAGQDAMVDFTVKMIPLGGASISYKKSIPTSKDFMKAEKPKSKFSTGIFVLLLLICFPAAIVYFFVTKR